MRYLNLIPKSGKDYKCNHDVINDWNCSKEFVVHDMNRRGKIINKDIVEYEKPVTVVIRYKKMECSCRIVMR